MTLLQPNDLRGAPLEKDQIARDDCSYILPRNDDHPLAYVGMQRLFRATPFSRVRVDEFVNDTWRLHGHAVTISGSRQFRNDYSRESLCFGQPRMNLALS
jgi:hypothetical protein